mgnify:CR=1 FL=1
MSKGPLDGVRVLELGEHARLAEKPRLGLGVELSGVQRLQRDLALQALVEADIHGTHAARGDEVDDAKVTDLPSEQAGVGDIGAH